MVSNPLEASAIGQRLLHGGDVTSRTEALVGPDNLG